MLKVDYSVNKQEFFFFNHQGENLLLYNCHNSGEFCAGTMFLTLMKSLPNSCRCVSCQALKKPKSGGNLPCSRFKQLSRILFEQSKWATIDIQKTK